MGLTQNLGRLSPSIFSDSSLNIGVGAAPSGTYKFEVTGTAKVSGILTLGSTISNGTYAYTLPSATGTLALTSAIPANPVGGTGTTNTIPKFTASSTIGDSAITDDGTTVTLVSRALSGTSASFSSITTSSTTANGALVVAGGVGIGGETNIAGTTIFGVSASGNSKFYIYGGFSAGVNLLQNYSGSVYTTEEHRASDYSFKIGTSTGLILNTSGNLGLGVTPSQSSVGINKILDIGGATVPGIVLHSTSNTSEMVIGTGGDGLIISASGSANAANDNIIRFFTAATNSSFAISEKMRLFSDGNLLLTTSGTLTNAGYKLDVNGTGRFTGALTGKTFAFSSSTNSDWAASIDNLGTTNANGLYVNIGASSTGVPFAVYKNFSELFKIANTGAATFSSSATFGSYVSVGNTGSLTKLNVNNAVSGAILPYIQGTGLSYNSEGISVAGSNTNNTNIGNGITFYNNVASVGAYGPVVSWSSMTVGGAYNATYAFITGVYGGAGGDNNWAVGDLIFGTGNSYGASERMRITSGGNVGIGTSSASEKLEVEGRINIKSGFALYLSNGNNTATSAIVNGEANTTSSMLFYTGGAERFSISSTGILKSLATYNNTTGIAANVQIDSNGYLARSTVSSLRFKENIKDWNGGLDIILALKPRTFNYKKDYYDKADIEFLGLIAEEVAEVSPYLADYENEDRTGQVENVRYANIVVPLIKAVQELEARLKTIENK